MTKLLNDKQVEDLIDTYLIFLDAYAYENMLDYAKEYATSLVNRFNDPFKLPQLIELLSDMEEYPCYTPQIIFDDEIEVEAFYPMFSHVGGSIKTNLMGAEYIFHRLFGVEGTAHVWQYKQAHSNILGEQGISSVLRKMLLINN